MFFFYYFVFVFSVVFAFNAKKKYILRSTNITLSSIHFTITTILFSVYLSNSEIAREIA